MNAALTRTMSLAAGLILAGAAPPPPDCLPGKAGTDWRRTATDDDRTRIRNWRDTWIAAVAAARATDGGAVAAEDQLLNPDRALDEPIPPAGDYRCRTLKLGAQGTATRGFTAEPWFACRIEPGERDLHFAQIDGPQRPVGKIYQDGTGRGVFLGTLALGQESKAMKYARDPNRDLAGLVERVGPKRWRIGFPAPRFEAQLKVVELVPAN